MNSIDNLTINREVRPDVKEGDVSSQYKEFEIVGVSSDGEKIRGTIRIPVPANTNGSNYVDLDHGQNDVGIQLEVDSVGNQDGEFPSKSSSVESKDMFVSADGLVVANVEEPAVAVHFDTDESTYESLPITEKTGSSPSSPRRESQLDDKMR